MFYFNFKYFFNRNFGKHTHIFYTSLLHSSHIYWLSSRDRLLKPVCVCVIYEIRYPLRIWRNSNH